MLYCIQRAKGKIGKGGVGGGGGFKNMNQKGTMVEHKQVKGTISLIS